MAEKTVEGRKVEDPSKGVQADIARPGPRDPAPQELCRQGGAALARGETAEAEAMYLKALKADGACIPALNALGGIHLSRGEAGKAKECFKKSFRALPAGDSCAGIADSLALEGKSLSSVSKFEQAAFIYRDEARAARAAGAAEESGRLLDHAIRISSKSIALARSLESAQVFTGRAACTIAECHAEKGEAHVAEAWYRKSIRYDPGNITASHRLARLCLGKGDNSEACSLYSRVLSFNPEDIAALEGRAESFKAMGEHERAEEDMQMARELSKKRPGFDPLG